MYKCFDHFLSFTANYTSQDGRTTLMLAAQLGRVDIVQLLVDAGADKDRKRKKVSARSTIPIMLENREAPLQQRVICASIKLRFACCIYWLTATEDLFPRSLHSLLM